MSQIVYKESVTVVTWPFPPPSVRNKYLIWCNDWSFDYCYAVFYCWQRSVEWHWEIVTNDDVRFPKEVIQVYLRLLKPYFASICHAKCFGVSTSLSCSCSAAGRRELQTCRRLECFLACCRVDCWIIIDVPEEVVSMCTGKAVQLLDSEDRGRQVLINIGNRSLYTAPWPRRLHNLHAHRCETRKSWTDIAYLYIT